MRNGASLPLSVPKTSNKDSQPCLSLRLQAHVMNRYLVIFKLALKRFSYT